MPCVLFAVPDCCRSSQQQQLLSLRIALETHKAGKWQKEWLQQLCDIYTRRVCRKSGERKHAVKQNSCCSADGIPPTSIILAIIVYEYTHCVLVHHTWQHSLV